MAVAKEYLSAGADPGFLSKEGGGGVRWHIVPQRRRMRLGGRYGGGFGGENLEYEVL